MLVGGARLSLVFDFEDLTVPVRVGCLPLARQHGVGVDPLHRPVHVPQDVPALGLVQVVDIAGGEVASVPRLSPGGFAIVGRPGNGVVLVARRHPGALPTPDLGQGLLERQMRNQSRTGLRRVRRPRGVLLDYRLGLLAQQLQIERRDLAAVLGEVFGDQLHRHLPAVAALLTGRRRVLELVDVGFRLVARLRRLVGPAEGLLGSVEHAGRLLSESLCDLRALLAGERFAILGLQLVSVLPGASRAPGGLNALGPAVRPLGGPRPRIEAGCESLVHAIGRLPVSVHVGNAEHLAIVQQGGFEGPVVDEHSVGGGREGLVVLPDVEGLEGGVALFEDIVQLSLGNVAVAVFVDGADEAEDQREALGGALDDSVEVRLVHLILVPNVRSLEDAGPPRSIVRHIFFVLLQRDARHLLLAFENQLHRDVLKSL